MSRSYSSHPHTLDHPQASYSHPPPDQTPPRNSLKRPRPSPPSSFTSDHTRSSSSQARSVRWKGTNHRRLYDPRDIPGAWEEEGEEDDVGLEEEGVEEEDGGVDEGEPQVKGEKILAIHAPNGASLAAAFYDTKAKVLNVLEDTKDTVEWDLVILLLEQWNPDVVVMSSKNQDSVLDKVEEWCKQEARKFELVPGKTFQQSQAILTLSNLTVGESTSAVTVDPDAPGGETQDGSSVQDTDHSSSEYQAYQDEDGGMGKIRLNLVKLGCWVNVDAPKAVCVAGGLLSYLMTRGSEDSFVQVAEVPVDRIEAMSLEKHMLINSDALHSLAIFAEQAHASARGNRQKEGLSIFSLMKTTVTPLGHKLFHMWFLRPLADVTQIKARHDAVELFSHPMNRESVEQITRAMKKIKNIPIHLRRLRRGRGGYREWKALLDALWAAGVVKELVCGISGAPNLDIAIKVHGTISQDVILFQNDIGDMVDFETSKNENRVCIKQGVDEKLDQLQETFHSLHAILYAVARRVQSTMDPRWPVELNVEYFPSLGFLVRVTPLGPGFRPPRRWELKFSTDETTFFKTPETEMLDREFGDIDSLIQGRELEIVQGLVEKMVDIDKEVTSIMDIIAELDCLLALSRAVSNHSLTRPKMVDRPILEIRRGRHLIQERMVEHYVTNDTKIEGGPDAEDHNMMIVTGANGSGKSAYGKQVALIVFMAQIGGFVPAESATIGVVDKLYTRIQTRESSFKDASAFMIDLAQVSLALRGVTERSLVILDEFGKGTTPEDGAGLLAGVIEALINGACPRTVVLTHFQSVPRIQSGDKLTHCELFTRNIVDDSLPILHCYMKTELVADTTKLTYLYRLTPGKCLTSNAAACALAHGLPARIVQRGVEVSEIIARGEISKLYDQDLTPRHIKELKEAERLVKKFLSWDIDAKTQDVMMILTEMVESCIDIDEEEEDPDASGRVEVIAEAGPDHTGQDGQDGSFDTQNGSSSRRVHDAYEAQFSSSSAASGYDQDQPIEVDDEGIIIKSETMVG